LAIFPNEPEDGLKAAVEIQNCVNQLNAEGFMQGLLKVGIGVHKGPVLMGTVGHTDRMDVTVIATTVNIASRLENLTKFFDAKILTTDKVLQTRARWSSSAVQLSNSEEPVYSRFVGHLCPKGVSTPLRVFSVDIPAGEFAKLKPHRADVDAVIDFFESSDLKRCVQTAEALLEKVDDHIVRTYMNKAQGYLKDGIPHEFDKLQVLPLVFDQKFG